MGIGGSARNDGVNFISDSFTVNFTMGKDGVYVIRTSNRIIKNSKFVDTICKIPFLKALYKLFASDRLVAVSIAVIIVLDVLNARYSISSESSIWMRIAMVITFAFTLGFLFYTIKRTIFRAKLTRSFHGAEHKTIYAMENKMELTLENVRECPRIARRCGTNLVVFLLPINFVLSFFTPYASLQFILSFMLAYEIFDAKRAPELPVIRLFYKLGYFCQEKLFTSEPTNDQLIAAIATMKKLLELESSAAAEA